MVFKFDSLAPNRRPKILAEFKHGDGASGPFIKECCHASRLRYLNKATSLENLQKIKLAVCWHQASYMYSLCRGVLGGAMSTTACIMSLCIAYEIILADFNLMVSIPTAKLPNLIPHQIFRLYGMFCGIMYWAGRPKC